MNVMEILLIRKYVEITATMEKTYGKSIVSIKNLKLFPIFQIFRDNKVYNLTPTCTCTYWVWMFVNIYIYIYIYIYIERERERERERDLIK
jgi:hypothetical protein